VLLTARQLKESCGAIPFIYRAGVWKPRTSPYSYQGAGAEGLKWLLEVQQTLGLPVATEVATPAHVTEALRAGIDYLWIGARTSANPIAVEAISNQLSATDNQLKAVFIKNPVNADAALWIGNIERLERTGVPVTAVHRGCNHQPCWRMAHQVRLARPDIPMLLDPSHMSGDAAQVPALMRKINELSLNGAMIEVHCCPEQALSDARQQVKPSMASAILKDEFAATNDVELSWLRAEIDELDERLWDTIAARMEVSERIGTWKKAHGVAPLQPERYQQIVEKLKAKGEKMQAAGLDADFMLHVWELIHAQSLKQQE
jgi:chorismate mutase